MIKKQELRNCTQYKLVNDEIPIIQYGLFNEYSDVMYSLNFKPSDKLVELKIDKNALPLVLSKHQYAPYNSHNTFFHYNSFWTLLFPSNVTVGEFELLRAYISIRLLQEINGRIAFMTPNDMKIRNIHSYSLEDSGKYVNIEQFIKDLNEWQCESGKVFKQCFIECIEMLVNKRHLNVNEKSFYKSWINDLDRIGYKWPLIDRMEKKSNHETVDVFYFKAVQQNDFSNSNINERSAWNKNLKLSKLISACNISHTDEINPNANKIDNFILVIFLISFNLFELS